MRRGRLLCTCAGHSLLRTFGHERGAHDNLRSLVSGRNSTPGAPVRTNQRVPAHSAHSVPRTRQHWFDVGVDQQLTTVGASLARSDERMLTGRNAAGRVWKTGFGGLDQLIGGGLRAGSLILLAGPQGLGKSTFALQLARNTAASGRPVLYFSYEHDAEDLTQKLIAMEAGELDESDQARMNAVRSIFDDLWVSSLEHRLEAVPCGPQALAKVAQLLRDAVRPPVHRHAHRHRGDPVGHRDGPRAQRQHAAGDRRLPPEDQVGHGRRRG